MAKVDISLESLIMAELPAAVDEGFESEVSDEESDYGSMPELESIPETDEGLGDLDEMYYLGLFEVPEEEEESEVEDESEEEDEDLDTEGLQDEDIELVMRHANVSRGKAVGALKNNANDVINAILEIEISFGQS